ncbi:MAG: flagellin [Oligoflexia bacterium]|nr:MAG: flagellin [Oligoflexia bacterium]
MGMRVSTNISSINAQRNLSGTQRAAQRSMAQMSSGNRINVAADDAAGLAISERLKGSIRSAQQANRNANDGISMVQVAEGGLQEIGNIVVRMRELGIRAASETVGGEERYFIDFEIQQLKSEIQRIADSTKFNSSKLLDGSAPVFDFQVGINNNAEEDRIQFKAGETVATLDALGLDGVNFITKEDAANTLDLVDNAQTYLNGMRANLGALQNRLVSTVDNLSVYEENMSAANSRIRDTDVAQASSEVVRNNILMQASTATLSQANQNNMAALKLIG